MNMRALNLATRVSEELDAIADAMRELHGSIENDNEEDIENALSGFPAPKAMARTFEKLGDLLTNHPWESGRKVKKNG
jgi:hypothetical protein